MGLCWPFIQVSKTALYFVNTFVKTQPGEFYLFKIFLLFDLFEQLGLIHAINGGIQGNDRSKRIPKYKNLCGVTSI